MALFVRAPHPTPAVTAAATTLAAVDSNTMSGRKSVSPEPRYVAGAAAAIVVGGIAGTILFDHVGKSVIFTPPQGLGPFAVFYVIAQVIERLQEPLTPWLGTAPVISIDGGGAAVPRDTGGGAGGSTEGPRRENQLRARAALEIAVANAHNNPGDDPEDVANKKRTLDQIRENLKVLLFGTSAMLGMAMAGYLKAGFLSAVGVANTATWFNIVVTGFVVGGGTKGLHDLISNIEQSKDQKGNGR